MHVTCSARMVSNGERRDGFKRAVHIARTLRLGFVP